jgi:predicted  nucleic acid-binding Zn-ribbon protein
MAETRTLKATTREDMRDLSLTEENFKKLQARYERLEKIYDLAQGEIAILEKQIGEADRMIERLRDDLAKVRKDLQEEKKRADGLEIDVIDLRKRVATLEQQAVSFEQQVVSFEQQIVSLQTELDTTKEERDRYKRESEVLKETDPSTPSSSEVALETLEDGPEIQEPVAGESSRQPRSQPRVAHTEQKDRDGSPSRTAKDSEIGAPLAEVPSGSSGTHSSRRSLGKVLGRNSQTSGYAGVVPGTIVLKKVTMTIREFRSHKSKNHDRKKTGHRRKSSKESN